jgi:putative ABC transport system permease protein
MLTSYLKLAWRVLLRRKFFTFISLFGISLTLVVLLVAAAMLDGIFAPRAPESRAERTLGVYQLTMAGRESIWTGGLGYAFLDRTVRHLAHVERCALFTMQETALSYPGGRKISSYLKRTDGDYWRILDFDFLEGGAFTGADEDAGNPVAVINETTRRRFFGGGPALGRPFDIDGQRFRVVGVVRDVPIVRIVPFADVWVPISTAKESSYKRGVSGNFMAILLARSRADFPAIKSEFQSRMARIALPDPKLYDHFEGGADTQFEGAARFFFAGNTGDTHPERLAGLLFILMLLFMLVPTLNLVNINLSRILDRAAEIGVRKAFGASSLTLTGQFLVENLLLTLIGGAIALALAVPVLAALNTSGLIPYAQFSLNLHVFSYGLGLALFFALLSGVYPAWKMSRLQPAAALGGRS